MKITPLVSVVIPIFCGENSIGQCLDSISGQSMQDFEVIVVDDASTDNSKKVISDYRINDSRIRLIENEINLNSYETRCRGFDLAEGKYIVPCDCDDNLPRDALLDLCKAAEANNAQIVHGRTRELINGRPGKILRVYDPFRVATGEKFALSAIYNLRGWNLWGKLFTREVWEKAKYMMPRCTGWHTADDLLTSIVMAVNAERYIETRAVVYHYKQPEANYFSIQSRALKDIDDHVKVLSALFSLLERKKLCKEFEVTLDYLTTQFIAAMNRNLSDSIEVRKAAIEIIKNLPNAKYLDLALCDNFLRDIPKRTNDLKELFFIFPQLIPIVITAIGRLGKCGHREVWISLCRALDAAKKRGWRKVISQMKSH